MIVAVLAIAAVLGTIAFVVVMFVQRGRDGTELSAAWLLRLYLSIASLAGLIVLTIGLASLANYTLARAAGYEFVYGGVPSLVRPACPPDTVGKGCVEPTPEQLEQQRRSQDQEHQRRLGEEIIRGITFVVFGGLFWVAHWAARRALGTDPSGVSLRRGYLLVGTVVFGIATVILLPTGIYQVLANVLLATPDNVFRQGAEALGGGIASTPIWLLYLRQVVVDFRQSA